MKRQFSLVPVGAVLQGWYQTAVGPFWRQKQAIERRLNLALAHRLWAAPFGHRPWPSKRAGLAIACKRPWAEWAEINTRHHGA